MIEQSSFLSVEQLLAIHRRVIREFGGTGDIRNRGLLESAAAVPSAQFSGKFLHPDLAAMAGAYLFHICRNHPFIDGNKRVALTAAEVFLTNNGCRLEATDDELYELTIGVASGRINKDDTAQFFRSRIGQSE